MKRNDKIQTPKGIGIVHQKANDWVIVQFKNGSVKTFKKKSCSVLEE